MYGRGNGRMIKNDFRQSIKKRQKQCREICRGIDTVQQVNVHDVKNPGISRKGTPKRFGVHGGSEKHSMSKIRD